MVHPRFVKIYAIAVSIFAGIVLLLFVSLMGMGLWYIANPAVTELKDFTYQDATSGALQLGLRDENKHIFRNIDMEDFRQRPEYYFNIAKVDYERRIAEITLQMMSFSLIFVMVFIMHIRLWRRMRAMGE